jgi:hypothetical protein
MKKPSCFIKTWTSKKSPSSALSWPRGLIDKGVESLRELTLTLCYGLFNKVCPVGGTLMAISIDKLTEEIKSLPDIEKLRLVDAILSDLDRPDPELDRIWAEEARKRWKGYKSGLIPTLSYNEVLKKYRS